MPQPRTNPTNEHLQRQLKSVARMQATARERRLKKQADNQRRDIKRLQANDKD
ncbi:hypothetical protein ACMYR3_06050 [Ampullimonas aquatilis]|uniref:hypothetical protein n=1 Tax=Ampullimonas aquatilis TaxID=1341549 RepID=UPI003C766420